MNAQPVATNRSDRTSQIFYRWNLAPSTAAMWQLAMQFAGRSLVERADWIDLGRDWSWFGKPGEKSDGEFDRTFAARPPAAIVLGVDRSNLADVAGRVFQLREFFESSERDTFIIGWFPEADREAMGILRELGFDLVLHEAASLRAALAGVSRFGNSSQK